MSELFPLSVSDCSTTVVLLVLFVYHLRATESSMPDTLIILQPDDDDGRILDRDEIAQIPDYVRAICRCVAPLLCHSQG